MIQTAEPYAEIITLCQEIARRPGVSPRVLQVHQRLLHHLQTIGAIEDESELVRPQQDTEPIDEGTTGEDDVILSFYLNELAASLSEDDSVCGVGVDLSDVRARLVHIRDVIAVGTGVRIDGATFDEAIRIEGVHAGRIEGGNVSSGRERPEQSGTQDADGTLVSPTKTPPAVVLHNVQAGGGIQIGPIIQMVTRAIAPDYAARRDLRSARTC